MWVVSCRCLNFPLSLYHNFLFVGESLSDCLQPFVKFKGKQKFSVHIILLLFCSNSPGKFKLSVEFRDTLVHSTFDHSIFRAVAHSFRARLVKCSFVTCKNVFVFRVR